jgi:phage virion morphogenesis protein
MFTLRRNDISPKLTRLIKSVKPPERKRILRAMGTTFKSITEGTFNSVGSQYRPKPWPAKKDGTPSNLQKTTTLSKSFQLEVTDDAATLSNPTKYAATHQFGRDWGRGSPIPARPFYPVADGKLTPDAEKLIARAGQRVMENIAGGK